LQAKCQFGQRTGRQTADSHAFPSRVDLAAIPLDQPIALGIE
jgi:hypothetical protein